MRVTGTRQIIGIFDLFRIGIGPSSSHTVGPMLAAGHFRRELERRQHQNPVELTLSATLEGSLAATGRGHATDVAVMLGLAGLQPESVTAEQISHHAEIARTASAAVLDPQLQLHLADHSIEFASQVRRSHHPNSMILRARDPLGATVLEQLYYSVGGGTVVLESSTSLVPLSKPIREVPATFTSGAELLAVCDSRRISVSEAMWRDEMLLRSESDIRDGVRQRWEAMSACIDAGLRHEGILPGGLRVKRRAPELYRRLQSHSTPAAFGPLDWVNLYAMAVNEENAAGHRVVTAPTNGAAGIVPAVLRYTLDFVEPSDTGSVMRFLLAAAAIGSIIKRNASISGAEVGCQGEVGSASAMAAAGLTEILGGTPAQVENAAEIAMEHNLGLTCDPIGGLVQIPCIERNAVGANHAINAARIAMSGDGTHRVSLDSVVETMRQTGMDMNHKYKETSRGGLAVANIEC